MREGKAIACVADPHGGTRQRGELIADTLPELRAMLLLALTRGHGTELMPPSVSEVWG
jgi:hypothetical protein